MPLPFHAGKRHAFDHVLLPESEHQQHGNDHVDGNHHHLVQRGNFAFKALLGVQSQCQGPQFLLGTQVDEGRQEIVPGKLNGKDGHGRQYRLGIGHHDPGPDSQLGTAVHAGRIAEFQGNAAEELAHQEDVERVVAQQTRDDQGPERADHAQAVEDHEQGNDLHHMREHHGAQQDVEDGLAGRKLNAGKGVPGQGTDHHPADDRGDHHVEGVLRVAQQRRFLEDGDVVGPLDRVGNQLHFPQGHGLGGLEGGREGPDQGKDHDDRRGRQQRVHKHPFGDARYDAFDHSVDFRLALCVPVVDPAIRSPDHDDGKEQNDQEQDHGKGGRVAQPEVAERVVVDVDDIEEPGIERAAAGAQQDIGRREDLEPADDADNQVEEDDRCQHGNGDPEQLLPVVAPVHFGRFVELRGNALQSGQENDHLRAETPGTHDDHGGLDPFRTGQPAHGRQIQQDQYLVENAVSGVEHPEEDDGHRHQRHHGRDIENGAERAQGPDAQIQQDGNGEGHHQPHRHAQGQVVDRIAQTLLKKGIQRENLVEILGTDPVGHPGGDTVVRKGKHQVHHEGDQIEPEGRDNPGQNEREAYPFGAMSVQEALHGNKHDGMAGRERLDHGPAAPCLRSINSAVPRYVKKKFVPDYPAQNSSRMRCDSSAPLARASAGEATPKYASSTTVETTSLMRACTGVTATLTSEASDFSTTSQ